MLVRVIVLLLVAAGLAWHFQLLPPALLAGVGQAAHTVQNAAPAPPAAPMYKWKDAKGQVVYGNQPPPGQPAERLSGERGSVSVVEATKLPPPAPSQPAAGDPTLRDKMMDRVIDGPPPGR